MSTSRKSHWLSQKKWMKIWSSGPKTQKHFLSLGKSAKNQHGTLIHKVIPKNAPSSTFAMMLDMVCVAIWTGSSRWGGYSTTLDLDDRVFLTG